MRYPHELGRKGNIVAFLTELIKPKYNLSPRANNWVRSVVSREYQKGIQGSFLWPRLKERDAEFGHMVSPATRGELPNMWPNILPGLGGIWRKCPSSLSFNFCSNSVLMQQLPDF